MPLVIMSFFGDGAAAPITDPDLHRAYAIAQSKAPDGCKVEARALDRTFIDNHYQRGVPPTVIFDDPERLPSPISSGVISIWMNSALDNVEMRTREVAQALHDALDAIGTVTFDARCHLDLVRDGPTPTLQAVAVVERSADLDRDSFIQYYRTHHVPLAKSLKPRFMRYTTFRTLERIGTFNGDCVTIQEYPSLDAIREHLLTRTSQGDSAGDDIVNFITHLTYNIGERTLD